SPFALFLGSERSGLSEPALLEADLFIHIPMADRVESLNVATAAAILLYETARQRGFSFNTGRERREDQNRNEYRNYRNFLAAVCSPAFRRKFVRAGNEDKLVGPTVQTSA